MLLSELTQLRGVSGDESEIRNKLKELAEPLCDEMRVDALGNLICIQKGDGPLVMLAAHMDEVGLIVQGIDDRGQLHFAPVGAIDARVLVSKRVLVGKDRIPGVIGAKAIHLQSEAEYNTALKHKDLTIDIGCDSACDTEKYVAKGDTVVFDSDFVTFGDGLIKAKALDDRAGCYLLLKLMEQRYPCRLAAVFTVQEEVGMRGARVAAHALAPDLAIVVETTAAGDMADVPAHRRITQVGHGPALTVMDRASIGNVPLRKTLARIADDIGIRWQIKEGATGGNDAGAIALSGAGVPTAVISNPCRYIHSPSSVMNSSDMLGAEQWLRAFLTSGAHIDR